MKHTIVCIDDEEHNNQALERLLRKNYKIITATSPSQGLEIIERHKPTLIISDQRMPEMTGVDLLKKSMTISPDSVRILLTGYTDLESVIAAINDGQIYQYLTKPWEPTDLTTTVQQAVERYDLKEKIKKQNEELKSLDKLKTEFMLLISHELRTPLTGITSFLELLAEEVKDKEHKMYCKHIEKNLDRMKELVEDVLLITKFRQQTASYEDQNVNINNLIEQVWKSHENTPGLSLKSNGEELLVNTTQAILKNIFSKIIENCFEHSKEKSEISVATKKEDTHWTIQFTNTSAKPLPKDTKQLLDSFRRNEEIMNHTKGTGLGLSVVQSLTQYLKGKLELTTNEYTFSMKLSFPYN